MLEQLDHSETLALLHELSDDNALLKWWSDCYGSPANPEFLPDGRPYPTWQREYYDAGAYARQRMIIAANGVGKSQSVCAEAAAHFTGVYPDWWIGERFNYGGWECWIGSIDNDMQKRGPQRALLGRNLEDQLGKGLIPANCIVDMELRQAGVKGVVDTCTIKHLSGNNVTVKWLTFEQGWRKWQSGDPKIILWDEEPDENVVDQKDILSEALTRLVRNNGIFMVGYTPLLGETQLTEHFMDSEDSRVFYITAGWDDAPHMSEEDKQLIRSQYKAHEIEARTQGVPMMGEGRILTAPEAQYICDPIRIPDHWSRLKGIDFGISHPAATVDIAHDRDNDIIYITKCWKKRDQTLGMHAQQINAADDWIPVAWPHDGEKRDPNSGKQFHWSMRHKYHVNMLGMSARYKADTGGAQPQWPIIDTVNERMESGRLKVFRTCTDWIKEARSYHTKNGLIVAKKDDVLKASFYAIMMVRYARSRNEGMRRRKQQSMAFTTAAS
jgi:phage terminase large subunit-like protein